MACSHSRRVAVILLALGVEHGVGVARAEEPLTLLTEEDPPYSSAGRDGRPSGFGVDVVREIQGRLGRDDPIDVQPWARAYATIQRRPNVVLFTMSLTQERAPLFQWVGPIIENHWVLIGKKGSGIAVADLAQARRLPAIGVVRDYAWDRYLTGLGFHNLERVADNGINLRKLNKGYVQAIVSSNLSYREQIVAAGFSPADFEVLLDFQRVQMYIAHSKLTDPQRVQRWQAAFEAMRADGSLQRLLKRWLPDAELPGPARAPAF